MYKINFLILSVSLICFCWSYICLAGIPDSRAIYEAKKKREQMKHGGYIPLEDKNAPAEKVVRQRLVREDENDGSDDEDHGRFYSSKELLRNEEERRREEQNEFLEQEQVCLQFFLYFLKIFLG